MTEPIPLWEDWRLWSILAAFFGFTFGTWIKHWFDLRRDDRLRAQQSKVLAVGLLGEMMGIRNNYARAHSYAQKQLDQCERGEAPDPLLVWVKPGVSSAVFANNAAHLGLLVDEAVIGELAQFYSALVDQDDRMDFTGGERENLLRLAMENMVTAQDRAKVIEDKLRAVIARFD